MKALKALMNSFFSYVARMMPSYRTTPGSIRYFLDILRVFGLILKPNQKESFLRRAFFYFQIMLIFVGFLLHLCNTIGRAHRNIQEFFSLLLEDCIWLILFMGLHMFNQHYEDIVTLSNFMETSFSHANRDIIRRCQKQATWIFYSFAIAIFGAQILSVIEKVISISEAEIAMRKYVYGTHYPSRRPFLPWWLPSVDETQDGLFQVQNVIALYLIVILTMIACLYFSFIPTILTHLSGQYDILSGYIQMIGHEHTDPAGIPIYYTDIETNQYIYDIPMCSPTSEGPSGMGCENISQIPRQIQYANWNQNQTLYEKAYLRQVIKFHQKLCSFQSKVILIFL